MTSPLIYQKVHNNTKNFISFSHNFYFNINNTHYLFDSGYLLILFNKKVVSYQVIFIAYIITYLPSRLGGILGEIAGCPNVNIAKYCPLSGANF